MLRKNYVPSFYQQSQDAQAENEYNETMEEANQKNRAKQSMRGARNRLGLGQRLLGEGRSADKEIQELRGEEKDLKHQASIMRRNIDEGRARGFPHRREVMERPTILEGVEDMNSLSTMGQNFTNFPPSDANEASRSADQRTRQRSRGDAPEAMENFRPSWMGR